MKGFPSPGPLKSIGKPTVYGPVDHIVGFLQHKTVRRVAYEHISLLFTWESIKTLPRILKIGEVFVVAVDEEDGGFNPWQEPHPAQRIENVEGIIP